MTDLFPMSDLAADDLLLDRLGSRQDAGAEPIAALLGALAAHADTPLPARTVRRKVGRKHRYLGAFAAIAVAASGAGVAAAVTLPQRGLSPADRARIEQKMEQNARSDAPSGLLTRLGLPQTSGTTEARGLVLYRQPDGTIVLLPASVVAAADASGGIPMALGAASEGTAQGGKGNTAGASSPSGNAWGAAQGGQGGNSGNNAAPGSQAGGAPSGEPTDPGNQGDPQGSETPAPTGPSGGNQGGNGNTGTVGKGILKGKNATPTPTPTPSPTPTDPQNVDLLSTVATPPARLKSSPSPRSTTPVRVPKLVTDPGTADTGATGTGATGSGATGAATGDPGTDASTSAG